MLDDRFPQSVGIVFCLVILEEAAGPSLTRFVWGVVGFWRGAWYIMDASLWDFETTESLYWSIFYSYIIGVVCLGLASEDVVRHFPSASEFEERRNLLMLSHFGNQLFGRVRTVVLAIGAVNFWRGGWLTWDEWLGSTTTWSAALAHVIAIIVLTVCGCLSCITAPPSTLGADAVAEPGTIVHWRGETFVASITISHRATLYNRLR